MRALPGARHLFDVWRSLWRSRWWRWTLSPLCIVAAFAAGEPTLLQVRVVDGDGAVYSTGSRATHGIGVLVTDEVGRPVDGATVTFRLPETGPGGVFATGAKTEILTTRSDGRASVWGMQWNHAAGSFEVRITAIKGSIRAGTACLQSLTNGVAASPARAGPGHGHKWLWISLAAAGAAAGGAAVLNARKPAGASPSTALQFGTPTIVLGRP